MTTILQLGFFLGISSVEHMIYGIDKKTSYLKIIK